MTMTLVEQIRKTFIIEELGADLAPNAIDLRDSAVDLIYNVESVTAAKELLNKLVNKFPTPTSIIYQVNLFNEKGVWHLEVFSEITNENVYFIINFGDYNKTVTDYNKVYQGNFYKRYSYYHLDTFVRIF